MKEQHLWPFAITLISILIIGVVVARYRQRWDRLTSAYRQMEEYADTVLQHGQGTILNVQGLINDLGTDHPVRRRIEDALSRAERELSELRETMEPHCSEQQEERIQ